MKSVVICGSKRFKEEAIEFGRKLRELGVVTYVPRFHQAQAEWEKLSEDYKGLIAMGLTHDHFYKIRMADIVFVYNKDGYAGVSTTLEMGFAVALGKPIYALSPDPQELCRQVIFKEIISSPEELIKKLQ